MTTHRFLIESPDIDHNAGSIKIADAKQVKQISRVLRLAPDDHIDVVDGAGTVYRVKLENIGEHEVFGRIIETTQAQPSRRAFKITVLLPLLKGGNFESTLQKLTEIGVDTIVPIITERTVVKLDAEGSSKTEDKMRRWLSIVKEATEQCERSKQPELRKVMPLEKALNDLRRADNASIIFICAERSQAPHMVTIAYNRLNAKASPAIPLSDICIVIGPEGGYTKQEMDYAISLGCTPCSLGDNILRSETAATVAAALVAGLGEFL